MGLGSREATHDCQICFSPSSPGSFSVVSRVDFRTGEKDAPYRLCQSFLEQPVAVSYRHSQRILQRSGPHGGANFVRGGPTALDKVINDRILKQAQQELRSEGRLKP
jgi:hypothetical protein